jgi:DNA-binding MarR family transcriptional regulator
MAADVGGAERLAGELFRLVRLVERSKAQAAAAKPEHLERAVFGLLVQLVDNGPMRLTALAEAVYVDVSTVSRQVNQLVGLGLVQRQADPKDGRASLLAATTQGRDCLIKARRHRNQRIAALTADWSPQELTDLTRLLNKFNTAFETHRADYFQRPQRPGVETA